VKTNEQTEWDFFFSRRISLPIQVGIKTRKETQLSHVHRTERDDGGRCALAEKVRNHLDEERFPSRACTDLPNTFHIFQTWPLWTPKIPYSYQPRERPVAPLFEQRGPRFFLPGGESASPECPLLPTGWRIFHYEARKGPESCLRHRRHLHEFPPTREYWRRKRGAPGGTVFCDPKGFPMNSLLLKKKKRRKGKVLLFVRNCWFRRLIADTMTAIKEGNNENNTTDSSFVFFSFPQLSRFPTKSCCVAQSFFPKKTNEGIKSRRASVHVKQKETGTGIRTERVGTGKSREGGNKRSKTETKRLRWVISFRQI